MVDGIVNWDALLLSLEVAAWTTVILLPVGTWAGHGLARSRFRLRGFAEAIVALPLLLPPTVLGYYLLTVFGRGTPIGDWYEQLMGQPLVFTFQGLVVASILFNLPFAIQPAKTAFQGIEEDVREAAWCCGLSKWAAFWRIELPLAWHGVITAALLTFAHTMGEFGVVLMVGGNIPGETRTVAIAIYDSVQSFNDREAGIMSAFLLGLSMVVITLVYTLNDRFGRRFSRR